MIVERFVNQSMEQPNAREEILALSERAGAQTKISPLFPVP